MSSGWTPLAAPVQVISLLALGVRVDVEIFGPLADDLAAAMLPAWNRCLGGNSVASADQRVHVYVGPAASNGLAHGRVGLAVTTVAEAMHHLSSAVTIAAVEHQAGRLWMLHAAGLADPDSGACVALVGPSGTGKTTAARTLAREFGYVSDETVAVSRDGRIVAYPKPLSVVQHGHELKEQVGPAALGLRELGSSELHLAAVVLLNRNGSPGVEIAPVRTAAALPPLAEQTSYLTRLPTPLAFVADALAKSSGVFAVSYREAANLAPVVADLLGGQP